MYTVKRRIFKGKETLVVFAEAAGKLRRIVQLRPRSQADYGYMWGVAHRLVNHYIGEREAIREVQLEAARRRSFDLRRLYK